MKISTNILISLLAFVLLFLRRFHWYRYYITRIIIHGKNIYLEYYNWNKLLKLKVNINDLHIIKGNAFSMGTVVILIFKINKKKLFYQYPIIKWNNINLEKFYNEFKKTNKYPVNGIYR